LVVRLVQGWPPSGHRVGRLGEAWKYYPDLIPLLTNFGPEWNMTQNRILKRVGKTYFGWDSLSQSLGRAWFLFGFKQMKFLQSVHQERK
jgi:hypothetical protein